MADTLATREGAPTVANMAPQTATGEVFSWAPVVWLVCFLLDIVSVWSRKGV